jgi:ParB-like chromosome segregation protein Spo0J
MTTLDHTTPPATGPHQVLPPLDPDEYAALRDSIEKNGVLVPITVDEDGNVIDGHHRLTLANLLGKDCPRIVKSGLSEQDKRNVARSMNLTRRHLSQAQRRAIIRE